MPTKCLEFWIFLNLEGCIMGEMLRGSVVFPGTDRKIALFLNYLCKKNNKDRLKNHQFYFENFYFYFYCGIPNGVT
jgi:hypothetical protein